VRRIDKEWMFDEAYTIDATAKLLVYAERELIYIRLIRIPNSEELADVLRPCFNASRIRVN
jgi:hypothetical protein